MATEWVKKKFTHQFVLVALLVATALIGYTLKPFLDAILGAIILYVLFRPLMRRLVEQKKWKKRDGSTFYHFHFTHSGNDSNHGNELYDHSKTLHFF